ncbi:hypothetical protein ANN_10703, partial [Periplaneta americana]
ILFFVLIGRGGPVPSRSPDLTPLDFSFWDHLKAVVYSTPVHNAEEVLQRVENACQLIRDDNMVFERTRQSCVRRAQACEIMERDTLSLKAQRHVDSHVMEVPVSLPSKETLRGHSDSSFRGEGYIQCCVGVRLCDMYSNQELAEIHFMYGKADGNAALARRLYQERYPQRQCPDRKTFVRLHYRLCEYGKFNSPGLGRGRPRSTTPEVQEEILEAVNMTPSISTRRVALQVNVPHTTVWRLLESLRNRIVACSEDIRNTPGVWDRVRRSMRHRCEICIQAGGGHFEHLL